MIDGSRVLSLFRGVLQSLDMAVAMGVPDVRLQEFWSMVISSEHLDPND